MKTKTIKAWAGRNPLNGDWWLTDILSYGRNGQYMVSRAAKDKLRRRLLSDPIMYSGATIVRVEIRFLPPSPKKPKTKHT